MSLQPIVLPVLSLRMGHNGTSKVLCCDVVLFLVVFQADGFFIPEIGGILGVMATVAVDF